MSDDEFRKFLESEAKKNPLKMEGYIDKADILRDAEYLARRVSLDDYETIKRSWQRKSFSSIAFVLRRYGLEFKGLTYLESLVDELFRILEQQTGS